MIEDDELVRTPLAKMLEFLGWKVTEASSGENALLALKNQAEFAAILVDYSMTGMNGRQTLHAIRATGCKSPAILCSGYISNSDDTMSDQDFQGFLQKPFRRQQLEAMLKKVTGR